jgi:ADP-dependent NAD(P)H-hydrate dehydratase / NAD(P)H-hydrate epimerase
MQNLYLEVDSLDRRCYNDFYLSEEILMEHAADGMGDYIRRHFDKGRHIIIVCGSGNNGADGLVLSRLLAGDFNVAIMLPHGVKSPMCQLQFDRIKALHVSVIDTLEPCDILIDALFGSGFSRAFDPATALLLEQMNRTDAFKIACDMPSGLHRNGVLEPETFQADVTLTMGALKRGLYSDAAKTVCGSVEVIDLGISRSRYETPSSWQLLDCDDLKLPHRTLLDSHKGSYGHLGVICGEKEGAAIMAGSAALRFGTGLVTLISNEHVQIPFDLMQSHLLSSNTTALLLGMGLGQEFDHHELFGFLDHTLPLLLDADMFYHPLLLNLLERSNVVLTPHPKEFSALYKACGLGDITVAALQNDRFGYVERFCSAYPHLTLLLKGANVIIAQNQRFFINPHGSAILAKGGSGDILAGLIGALLAQGYDPLEAAIQGSLAHTTAAMRLTCNNYAMTPQDLISTLAIL